MGASGTSGRVLARRRVAAVGISLLWLVLASPASASHTEGVLDCGAGGAFQVDAGSDLPPGFEAPGPWSGLFLLEDTTQVFRAVEVVTPNWRFERAGRSQRTDEPLTCTLASDFDTPWTVTGYLVP